MNKIETCIEQDMNKLSNIKSKVDKSSGTERETWIKEWYKLVNIVAKKCQSLKNKEK